MKSSISLIGMAGAGKSSVGIKLAETLNLKFVDSDLLIEKNFNQNLQSILDDLGYLKLRSIEEETLLSINLEKSSYSSNKNEQFYIVGGNSGVRQWQARAVSWCLQISWPDEF